MSGAVVPPKGMRPMTEFDPTQPAIIHDATNDQLITWIADPEQLANYRMNAEDTGDGTIRWEGLILDGWGNVLGG